MWVVPRCSFSLPIKDYVLLLLLASAIVLTTTVFYSHNEHALFFKHCTIIARSFSFPRNETSLVCATGHQNWNSSQNTYENACSLASDGDCSLNSSCQSAWILGTTQLHVGTCYSYELRLLSATFVCTSVLLVTTDRFSKPRDKCARIVTRSFVSLFFYFFFFFFLNYPFFYSPRSRLRTSERSRVRVLSVSDNNTIEPSEIYIR